jgi:hypothetical protein
MVEKGMCLRSKNGPKAPYPHPVPSTPSSLSFEAAFNATLLNAQNQVSVWFLLKEKRDRVWYFLFVHVFFIFFWIKFNDYAFVCALMRSGIRVYFDDSWLVAYDY